MAEEMEDNVSRETSEEERDFVVSEEQQAQEQRPEWLPEKFKNPEDFAKSYSSLERRLSEGEDGFREQFMEEISNAVAEDVPDSADDYELPEGIDEQLAADDPLLDWWANHSHANNFTQEEFQEGIEMYRLALMDKEGGEIDQEAEIAQLGDNAPERLDAVRSFSQEFFAEEEFAEIAELCATATGVKAMERIMSAMSETGDIQSQASGGLNEDALKEMMRDERYWKQGQRDLNFVKEVDEGFEKLYR